MIAQFRDSKLRTQGDVIECGEDAAFKVVLTPAEAVRLANAIKALR